MSDDHDELSARLRRLEDLEAIRQLFIDYGRYLDGGDLDAYAGLFDEEEGEVLLGPIGRARGRAAIKEVMAKTLTGVTGNSFHLVTSPAIELDGDRATSTVMWTVVVRQPDGNPAVTMLGHHHDKLIRRHGRWFFLQRRGTVEIPTAYAGNRPD